MYLTNLYRLASVHAFLDGVNSHGSLQSFGNIARRSFDASDDSDKVSQLMRERRALIDLRLRRFDKAVGPVAVVLAFVSVHSQVWKRC